MAVGRSSDMYRTGTDWCKSDLWDMWSVAGLAALLTPLFLAIGAMRTVYLQNMNLSSSYLQEFCSALLRKYSACSKA